MWAAIPFFLSLILLASYVAFRMREEKSGTMVWAKARATADDTVLRAYRAAVTKDIPYHFRVWLVRFTHYITHGIVVLTVETLRAIERPLSRLSYRLRRNIPTGTGKAPSDFLQTITPVKRDNPDSQEKTDSV